jgi:DnaJ-class molecular chaperone
MCYAQVTRHVMDAASGRTLPVQEVLEVQVKPGWKEGTRVTFAGKGDEASPGTGADLVFVVKQQPHPRFERRGNDLHVRVKLPLVTALTGGTARVQMPDGRSLSLPISAPPVQPGAARLVVGEGMPISKGGGKGDLHVTFDVAFPAHLTAQQKTQLRQILPPSA